MLIKSKRTLSSLKVQLIHTTERPQLLMYTQVFQILNLHHLLSLLMVHTNHSTTSTLLRLNSSNQTEHSFNPHQTPMSTTPHPHSDLEILPPISRLLLIPTDHLVSVMVKRLSLLVLHSKLISIFHQLSKLETRSMLPLPFKTITVSP